MFLPALLLSSSFSFSFSTRYVGPSGPALTRAGDCGKAEQFKICTQFPRAAGAIICFSSVGSCSTRANALTQDWRGAARRGAAASSLQRSHAWGAAFSRLFVSGLARRGVAWRETRCNDPMLGTQHSRGCLSSCVCYKHRRAN